MHKNFIFLWTHGFAVKNDADDGKCNFRFLHKQKLFYSFVIVTIKTLLN